MLQIELLTVGKLKNQSLREIESDFLPRINEFKLAIHELKSNQVIEKINILDRQYKRKLPCFLLAEYGEQMTSKDFSLWLFKKFEINATLVFIIGGDCGHSDEVLERSQGKISLSAMTYPHQFARIMLIEQLYRAQCIKKDHPYAK